VAEMAGVNRQSAKTPFVEPDPLLDRLAYDVIGAAIEVHRTLGPGFLETVYEHALAHELEDRGIGFERQVPVGVVYKGKRVGDGRLDFLVDGRLVVEIKAVESLLPIHTAQVISYLRAINLQLGLLLNFNVALLPQGMKRVVRTP
jgi:GxxExxY protein